MEQTGTLREHWIIRTRPGVNGVDATFVGPDELNPGFTHAELKPFTWHGHNTFQDQLGAWQSQGLNGDVSLWWYNEQGVIGWSGWNWVLP